jgi:hypothetical protein
MIKKNFLFIAAVIVAVTFLHGVENFKLIQQWKHNKEKSYTRVDNFSLVDKENAVVGIFYMIGGKVITADKVLTFAQHGLGPNEFSQLWAMFPYYDDLAFVEFPNKIKILTKKDGNYVFKETRWIQRGTLFHIINDGVFFDKKWFLAGLKALDFKPTEATVSLLEVLDEKGRLLKDLLITKHRQGTNYHDMSRYLVGYKTDRVFFLKENELKVSLISSKTLDVVKEINLEVPSFYKKMPDNFYTFKKYPQVKDYLVDLENWATGYSRISKVLVEGNYLVLQIKTCSDKLKNYALLFYNADTFKLEKTIFMDDYLLGARNGKYYFFANGDPGLDENTDECIINIYSFKDTK